MIKKKTILTVFLFFAWVFPYPGMAQQKAEITDPVFTFDTVPEGTHVSHSFVIKNTGDALLIIEKVSPP